MNLIETTSKIESTPELVADLFCAMDSDQQAEFYNHIGKQAQEWSGGLCMQMWHVAHSKKLNATGRACMAKIGEWGADPNCDK